MRLSLSSSLRRNPPVSKPPVYPQLSVCLLSLGSACFIAYGLIGARLDADGMLHEPFALLPIGWALIAAGALTALFGFARARLRARSRRR